MTARDLLAECARRRIALWVDGDALRYRAPRGALADGLRAAITEHKTELLRLLAQEAEPRAGRYEAPGSLLADGSCFACGQAGWWLSPAGHLVCGICHPPAKPEDVRFAFYKEVVRYVH